MNHNKSELLLCLLELMAQVDRMSSKSIGCNTSNDLIEPAIKLAPVIKEVLFVLRKLKGTKTVGMSGSGATCFALFEPNDTVSVIKAEEQIKNYGWWTASTFLKGA